jgi:hypothetical protein
MLKEAKTLEQHIATIEADRTALAQALANQQTVTYRQAASLLELSTIITDALKYMPMPHKARIERRLREAGR